MTYIDKSPIVLSFLSNGVGDISVIILTELYVYYIVWIPTSVV